MERLSRMSYDSSRRRKRKTMRELSPRTQERRREQFQERKKRHRARLQLQAHLQSDNAASMRDSEDEIELNFDDVPVRDHIEEIDNDFEQDYVPYNVRATPYDLSDTVVIPVEDAQMDTGPRINAFSDDGRVINPIDELKKNLCDAIASRKARHDISDNGIQAIISIMIKQHKEIGILLENKKLSPNYRHSIRPEALRDTPQIFTDLIVDEISVTKQTKRLVFTGLEGISKKVLETQGSVERILVRIDSYTTLAEIKKFCHKLHREMGFTEEFSQSILEKIHISVDGVQESKSGKTSFIVVSLRFSLCGSIFLWRILQPRIGDRENKPTPEDVLRSVVDEVNADPETSIEYILCDGVERHFLRGLAACTGRWSCEICYTRGKTRYKGPIYFPSESSMDAPIRSVEEDEEIARYGLHKPPEERKGVVELTPIYDIVPKPDLWFLPLDEMHLCGLGICKKMIVRLFSQVNTKESRSQWKEVNRIYQNTSVFKEHSKTTSGGFSIKNAGAAEYSFLQLNIFPSIFTRVITNSSGPGLQVRIAMALFCFLVRLYFHDDLVLDEVEEVMDLRDLHRKFYKAFEKGFCSDNGKNKADPVVHQFFHLYDSRKQTGPLWRTSTEDFESSYTVLRRCYDPRTVNSPKQALENHYMHLKYNHKCGGRDQRTHQRFKVSSKVTKNVDDSHVVVGDNIFKVFQEVSCIEARQYLASGAQALDFNNRETMGQVYLARKVEYAIFNSPCELRLPLPWNKVGVFKFKGYGNRNFIVSHSEITGKALISGRVILQNPLEWLGSKYEK